MPDIARKPNVDVVAETVGLEFYINAELAGMGLAMARLKTMPHGKLPLGKNRSVQSGAVALLGSWLPKEDAAQRLNGTVGQTVQEAIKCLTVL